MDNADIDRLLELEEEATPGPLTVISSGRSNLVHIETDLECPAGAGLPICSLPKRHEADAELLAAARNLVRPLAEQARRVPELEAEIARLTRSFAGYEEDWRSLYEVIGLSRDETSAAVVADRVMQLCEAEAALAAAREENAKLRDAIEEARRVNGGADDEIEDVLRAALCAEIEQETREACAQLALQAEERPLDDNVSVLVYPSGEALAAAIRAGKP